MNTDAFEGGSPRSNISLCRCNCKYFSRCHGKETV